MVKNLFSKHASCFFSGDFRMIIGEDKSKVMNIVKPNMVHFQKLYSNMLQDCPQVVYKHHLGRMEVSWSLHFIMDSWYCICWCLFPAPFLLWMDGLSELVPAASVVNMTPHFVSSIWIIVSCVREVSSTNLGCLCYQIMSCDCNLDFVS